MAASESRDRCHDPISQFCGERLATRRGPVKAPLPLTADSYAAASQPSAPSRSVRVRGRRPSSELRPRCGRIGRHPKRCQSSNPEAGAKPWRTVVRAPDAGHRSDVRRKAVLRQGRQSLEWIAEGTREIRGDAGRAQVLKVALLSSFATNWLAPRLSGFTERHGDVDVQLISSIEQADVAGGSVDIAIRYGKGCGRTFRRSC
jgi:hypothetical protein